MPPVRLEEDGVDLLEIDSFGVIPHGFDQCANAEVSDGSDRAIVMEGREGTQRSQRIRSFGSLRSFAAKALGVWPPPQEAISGIAC